MWNEILQKNNAGADSKQLSLNFKKWRMAVIFKKLKKTAVTSQRSSLLSTHRAHLKAVLWDLIVTKK